MASFEALYYPYFEPPERWLRKYLLVFDVIRTIFPKDVNYEFSKEIIKIRELLPDAFETISPTDTDKQVAYSDFNFNRLDKAFKIIKENLSDDIPGELKLIINKNTGGLEIANHILLHDNKITDEINSLLEKNKLIKKGAKDLIHGLFNIKDFSVVNKQAGQLIVSILANEIGKRRGWHTLTTDKIDFSFNAINAYCEGVATDENGMLISSILKYEIPSDIENLPLLKYKEIRNAFADVRIPFHELVIKLSNLYRLERITEPQTLKLKVKEITKDFDKEVNKFKKSAIIKNLKEWSSIILESLAAIAGLFVDDKASKLSMEVSRIAMKSIEKIELKRNSADVKVQQFFAGIQERIEKEAIKKLI